MIDWKILKYSWRKTYSTDTQSITNYAWTTMEINLGLCGGKTVSNNITTSGVIYWKSEGILLDENRTSQGKQDKLKLRLRTEASVLFTVYATGHDMKRTDCIKNWMSYHWRSEKSCTNYCILPLLTHCLIDKASWHADWYDFSSEIFILPFKQSKISQFLW
jgi:glucose-6-phosphate 1-dehydrogenase